MGRPAAGAAQQAGTSATTAISPRFRLGRRRLKARREGGEAASKGAASCSACAAGYNSSSAGRTAALLAYGRYQRRRGKATAYCIEGTYSGVGATSCRLRVGRFSTTGSTACRVEPAKPSVHRADGVRAPGTSAVAPGSSSCLDCAFSQNSIEGATKCDRCQPNYFLESLAQSNVTCSTCPGNAVCEGALAMPVPTEGYWVNRKEARFAPAIHRCIRNTCKGAVGKEEDNEQLAPGLLEQRRLQVLKGLRSWL